MDNEIIVHALDGVSQCKAAIIRAKATVLKPTGIVLAICPPYPPDSAKSTSEQSSNGSPSSSQRSPSQPAAKKSALSHIVKSAYQGKESEDEYDETLSTNQLVTELRSWFSTLPRSSPTSCLSDEFLDDDLEVSLNARSGVPKAYIYRRKGDAAMHEAKTIRGRISVRLPKS